METNSISSENSSHESDQSIFESQFHALTDGFGKACDDHKVQLAFAVAIHPDNPTPIIFAKGHTYDVAVLVTKILNDIKSQMLQDLDLLD